MSFYLKKNIFSGRCKTPISGGIWALPQPNDPPRRRLSFIRVSAGRTAAGCGLWNLWPIPTRPIAAGVRVGPRASNLHQGLGPVTSSPEATRRQKGIMSVSPLLVQHHSIKQVSTHEFMIMHEKQNKCKRYLIKKKSSLLSNKITRVLEPCYQQESKTEQYLRNNKSI